MDSDDLFSNQPSISSLLTQLRRSTLTPHNRLKSIHSDAAFVAQVASSFPTYPPSHSESNSASGPEKRKRKKRPLVANERCGSWYIPPDKKDGSAYFKSTDGHERAWKFSTRRLNLHLIDMIEENDGIIIVDSTRRGKRKSPIISSNNNIFANSDDDEDEDQDQNQDQGIIFQDYRPVICCTASRRVIGSEVDEGGYIQGAGDDTENWALGLTPDVFWANTIAFLSAAEADVPDLIVKLVEEAKAQRQAAPSGDVNPATLPRKQLTPYLSVRAISPLDLSTPTTASSSSQQQPNECLILLTETPTPKETWLLSPTLLRVGLGKHKTASRNLRLALPEICSFATLFLQRNEHPSPTDAASNYDAVKPPQIVIACDSGKDLSVGVALALSCHLFDDEGRFRVPDDKVAFTKTLVKMRLGAVMTVYPEANPSRSTLQSVNSFLMDWRN
ncbi:hypothetical protein TrVFT333_000506 [Trichoderma virens FT-333]|nr:hypothetical protein TrVFT333_000506 [Trichoderma virens FT-333]